MNKQVWKLAVLIAGLSSITSCATTNNNYFQSGKPLGKDEQISSAGLSVGTYVDYTVIDEADKPPKVELGNTVKMAPLISFQGQKGVTEIIDVGGALGFGIFSFNFRLFSKLCLLDKGNKLGIGVLPVFNFSFTPDSLFGLDLNQQVLNANFYLSLPVSYDLSEHITLTASPLYGFEWSGLSVQDEDTEEDKFIKSCRFRGQGLSLGLIIKLGAADTYIYPELTLLSYEKGRHYIPYIGCSCSIPLLSKNATASADQ